MTGQARSGDRRAGGPVPAAALKREPFTSPPIVGCAVGEGKDGSPQVVVTTGPSRFNPGELEVLSVTVTYARYSADGINVVDRTESGTRGSEPTTLT